MVGVGHVAETGPIEYTDLIMRQKRATYRHLLWTMPLHRWFVRRLLLVAHFHALTVEHEHDGMPLYRLHQIAVSGPSDTVARYARIMRRAIGKDA